MKGWAGAGRVGTLQLCCGLWGAAHPHPAFWVGPVHSTGEAARWPAALGARSLQAVAHTHSGGGAGGRWV